MNSLYQGLIERIRGEVSDLDAVIERARQAWSSAQRDQEARYAYVDSVALNLHGFYSGLERLFELIARQVDGSVPDSETWHRDLLQQMVQDRPDLRPAVISPDNATIVDDLQTLFAALNEYGCPDSLVSDNGSVFKAHRYQTILDALQIENL